MPGYLDWALAKLHGAPPGACAFWVDLDHLLSARNHGGLADADTQSLTTDSGVEWQVVRYRANPFPGRQALSDTTRRTVVWCVGMPGDERVDLTAFEDHFARTVSVLNVSLAALAEDRIPGLDLPLGLGAAIAQIRVDLDAYLRYLQARHRHLPLNMLSASNALAGMLTGRETVVVPSDAPSALASVAVSLASADSPDAVCAIQLAANIATDTHPRLGPLFKQLASEEPDDLVALAYVAAGMASQSVRSLSAVLAADGWLSPELRLAFEKADGRWDQIAQLLNGEDLGTVARRAESRLSTAKLARLREAMAGSEVPIEAAVDEPLAAVRLAVVLARFSEFAESRAKAAGPGRLTDGWTDELASLDRVAVGLRSVNGPQPSLSNEREPLGYAQAFVASPVSSMHLALGQAKLAFRSIESLLPPSDAKDVARRLDAATERANALIDAWDAGWRQVLADDVGGFLNHPRQGWRLSRDFAEIGPGNINWLLVFDGLRYDMWRQIVVPTIQQAGWNVDGLDVSFCYLPSVTEVSRRTVIGGSPDAARGQEDIKARQLAERAGAPLTYLVRTEVSEKQHDEGEGWNVRVFSLPDKLVHSDILDMGTLSAQFEKWVTEELLGWFRHNIKPGQRVAVTTDHGFAELAEDEAIDVPTSAGEERNLPRVIGDSINVGSAGLQLPDSGRPATVATSRRWFKTPGGRRWRFAHGGSTLHEVVVPFAVLTAVREGSARFELIGLPARIEVEEGRTETFQFSVTVVGGADMFPTVTVTGISQLVRKSLQRGETTAVTVELHAEEGLDQLFIRVQSGSERHEARVPVAVALAKVKRTALDFDI